MSRVFDSSFGGSDIELGGRKSSVDSSGVGIPLALSAPTGLGPAALVEPTTPTGAGESALEDEALLLRSTLSLSKLSKRSMSNIKCNYLGDGGGSNRLSTLGSPVPRVLENDANACYYGAFGKETVIHALFPLSIPYILWCDGLLGLRNRTFLSLSIICFGQWFVSIAAWVILVLTILRFDAFVESSGLIEVMVALATHVLRSVLVAIKHGWRFPSLREDCKDGRVPRQRLREDEIISGWIVLKSEVLLEHLEHAAIRQDLNLQGFMAECDGPEQRVRAELGRAIELLPQVGAAITTMDDGKVRVPIQLLLTQATSAGTNNKLPGSVLAIRLVSALVIAGVLPILRLILRPHANPMGETWPTQVALTLAVMMQLGISFNFTSLIVFAAWADARRRTQWLKAWSEYIFDVRSPFSCYFCHHPEAWLLGRRAILDVGLGFRKRLDVFFGGMLVFVALLIVPLAVLSLQNEQSLQVTLFFAFVLVVAIMMAIALLTTSIAGYGTNSAFYRDAYRMHALSLDPCFSTQILNTHFDIAIRGLEFDSRTLALTLLGLAHGPTAFRAILSLSLFLISISLRQLVFGFT